MRKGEHQVVIYVKEEQKEFSITARKEISELSDVNEYMVWKGFTYHYLARDIDEDDANELLIKTKKEYKQDKGYTYVPRNKDDFNLWKARK
jgi:hypothetical protein